jgi:hypothetical protein
MKSNSVPHRITFGQLKENIISVFEYAQNQIFAHTQSTIKPIVSISVWPVKPADPIDIVYNAIHTQKTSLGTKKLSLTYTLDRSALAILCLSIAVHSGKHGEDSGKEKEYEIKNLLFSDAKPENDDDLFLSFDSVKK